MRANAWAAQAAASVVVKRANYMARQGATHGSVTALAAATIVQSEIAMVTGPLMGLLSLAAMIDKYSNTGQVSDKDVAITIVSAAVPAAGRLAVELTEIEEAEGAVVRGGEFMDMDSDLLGQESSALETGAVTLSAPAAPAMGQSQSTAAAPQGSAGIPATRSYGPNGVTTTRPDGTSTTVSDSCDREGAQCSVSYR
jgi:hypothetical protein